MSSGKILVERLDSLEKKHGIEINVNAFVEFNEYNNQFVANVIGEIFGDELDSDIKIIVSIYNDLGEIIGTDKTYIDSDNFEGIEAFSENVYAPTGENIAKVRVYPQKN